MRSSDSRKGTLIDVMTTEPLPAASNVPLCEPFEPSKPRLGSETATRKRAFGVPPATWMVVGNGSGIDA
jgi:hypothetical protein